MKKPQKVEIPVSKLSYNTVVGDFSYLDGEVIILNLNPKCVLVGLNNIPHMLFVTVDYNLDELRKKIGEDLYEVKTVVLKPTFSSQPSEEKIYYDIPDWILAFKKLNQLSFEFMKLGELWLLRNLPIQTLVLKKIKFDNSNILRDSILQFDTLTEITHDYSLGQRLIDEISSKKPQIKFDREAD